MNAAMKGTPSGRFLGVNLRQDRVSLADSEVAKAINADFHSQPGVIVLRLGRTAQDASALDDLAIRRLAKINDHRFRVAGQSLYCYDESYLKVLDGTLSSNLITTLMPFRPLNDSTIWAFVADDSVMKKIHTVDCSVGTWGLPATQGWLTDQAGTGTLTGSYIASYTYARLSLGAVAAEGNQDPLSQPGALSLSSESLGIGYMEEPSDTTTNALGIYRSVAGSEILQLDQYLQIPTISTYAITHLWEIGDIAVGATALQLDWSIALGTLLGLSNARGSQTWEVGIAATDGEDASGYHGTYRWEKTFGYVTTQTMRWAFCSTKADTALGAILEEDNGVPPEASWAVNFQEHAFLCRDADNPHYLWFSKRFKPEAFPAENFLEIGNPDDPLQCALPIGGQLGVFAKKTKYRVVGNAVTGFVALEAASPRGTRCPMAAITSERGITFVANDGIFNTFLAGPDEGFATKILPLFFGETVNDMRPLNWDQAAQFSAAMFKNRYYFAYADTASSTPNRIAVYSLDTENWYHYDHPLRALFVEDDTDLFLGGGLDGLVYILENGSTDGGAAIALDVETKDFEGQEGRDVRKLFQHLKLNTNTGGASITVKFYVDDTLKHTVTVSTSTRQETLLPLPQGVMGHHWRVKVTYTGSTRIRIYSCAALYLPLMVA